MKSLLVFACVALLSIPLFAQSQVETDPAAKLKDLEQRLTQLAKTSAEKDAEIAALKAAQENTPEKVEAAVQTRAAEFGKWKLTPIVKACHDAKGKALIATNAKGQLVYSGCII